MSQTDKQKQTESIELFINRLVEEKKFKDLTPEVTDQIKEDLRKRVEDRVNAAILNNLPEDKLAEFEKLVEKGDLEEVQTFCSKNIPELDQVIAAALLEFRKIYINS